MTEKKSALKDHFPLGEGGGGGGGGSMLGHEGKSDKVKVDKKKLTSKEHDRA